MYVCKNKCVWVCTVCMSVYLPVCLYVCMSVCVFACIYVYMYVKCMYVMYVNDECNVMNVMYDVWCDVM